jgi:hypothetical protein
MTDIKTFRKAWSAQQKELRAVLNDETQQAHAIDLFMEQHRVLHSAKVSPVDWSYEDDLLDGLPEEKWRCIPANGEHSILWNLWHITRIEDAVMNLLVAGQPQLFNEGNWQQRLNAPLVNSGNEIPLVDIVQLSNEVDVEVLRRYRTAVGKNTQAIVSTLTFADFKQKTDPIRLQQIMDEGVLVPEAQGILDYWSKRNIAGLLLVPVTRHNLVHLNEIYTLKQRKS